MDIYQSGKKIYQTTINGKEWNGQKFWIVICKSAEWVDTFWALWYLSSVVYKATGKMKCNEKPRMYMRATWGEYI